MSSNVFYRFKSLFQRTAQETQTPATSTSGAVTSSVRPQRMFGLSKTWLVAGALAVTLALSAGMASTSYAGAINKNQSGDFSSSGGDRSTQGGSTRTVGGETIGFELNTVEKTPLPISINSTPDALYRIFEEGPPTAYASIPSPEQGAGKVVFWTKSLEGNYPDLLIYGQMKPGGRGLEKEFVTVFTGKVGNSKPRTYVLNFGPDQYNIFSYLPKNSFYRNFVGKKKPVSEDDRVAKIIFKQMKGFLNALGKEAAFADGILKITRAPSLADLKGNKPIEPNQFTTYGKYLAPLKSDIELTLLRPGNIEGEDFVGLPAGMFHELILKQTKEGEIDVLQNFRGSGMPDIKTSGLSSSEIRSLATMPYEEYDELRGQFIADIFFRGGKTKPEWQAYFKSRVEQFYIDPQTGAFFSDEKMWGVEGAIAEEKEVAFQKAFMEEVGGFFFDAVVEQVERLDRFNNNIARPGEVIDYSSAAGTVAIMKAYHAQLAAAAEAEKNKPGFFKRVFSPVTDLFPKKLGEDEPKKPNQTQKPTYQECNER